VKEMRGVGVEDKRRVKQRQAKGEAGCVCNNTQSKQNMRIGMT